MSRLLIASAVALAAVLPLAPASAQPGFSEPSITVTAPRMRNEGRSASGAPIRTVETDSVVYHGDLDLRTRAGRRELDLRVEAAAEEACGFLEQHYPMSEPLNTPRECRNSAVNMAQAQVRDSVQRAAYYDAYMAAYDGE
ncbi:UrcA family protein [Novosphingobium sp. PS1R-30]|uniref:UrcA family protein n=1 Tax=Novosphingobium anseongense TaxID=3133436 RepID=A0ABU8RZL1_9SPHN